MTTKSWDPKCEELAKYFLEDEPELLADGVSLATLAFEIQQCIENEIIFLRNEHAHKKKEEEHLEQPGD